MKIIISKWLPFLSKSKFKLVQRYHRAIQSNYFDPIDLQYILFGMHHISTGFGRFDILIAFSFHSTLSIRFTDSFYVILGNERSRLWSGFSSACGISGPYRSLFVLLFCKIGGWKLWKNERLPVQLQLAGFTQPNTQIFHHYDWEFTTATMLRGIQISGFEFGYILFGKYLEFVHTLIFRRCPHHWDHQNIMKLEVAKQHVEFNFFIIYNYFLYLLHFLDAPVNFHILHDV